MEAGVDLLDYFVCWKQLSSWALFRHSDPCFVVDPLRLPLHLVIGD